MIMLAPIAKSIIKEGGKLFGSRASRVTTVEMNSVFKELQNKLGQFFIKMQLSKSLKSKADHGDIDIVVEPNTKTSVDSGIKGILGDKVKDYSKNGNIHSILYHSHVIDKDVHVDFLVASGEDFDSQFEYLSHGDFSGLLGVLARRLGYSYSIEGFFKVYVDKSGRHHKLLITKNLMDGLKIMGYGDVLSTYNDISNPDDIVKFIISSPFFDSDDYKGQDFNHSDRKRVRSGRKTADYARNGLINSNIKRKSNDFECYFKSLFPTQYDAVQKKIQELETKTVVAKKYTGEWILKNFDVKPSPIITQIKNHWKELFGDKIDDQPEEEMRKVTQNFLNKVII